LFDSHIVHTPFKQGDSYSWRAIAKVVEIFGTISSVRLVEAVFQYGMTNVLMIFIFAMSCLIFISMIPIFVFVDRWEWGLELQTFCILNSILSIKNTCTILEDANYLLEVDLEFTNIREPKTLFLLVMQGSLPTNALRGLRHLTNNATCYRCRTIVENDMHTLWDCSNTMFVYRYFYSTYLNDYFSNDCNV